MLQALILASRALWVGFGFLSIYPCCALEDAPGQLTWACICPEGHKVLTHLSASGRQGDVTRGSRNPTAHPCLHNWALPTVSPCTLCKSWEKISWGGLFLDRRLGFCLFLCVIPAFPAGGIPNWNLGFSAHSVNAACQRAKKCFPSNSIAAAAAYTSDSRALLYIITT